jgi:hypothetical protein
MIGVHHNLEAARRLDSLTVHGLPDRIHIGGARLDNGLRPHSEANKGVPARRLFGSHASASIRGPRLPRILRPLSLVRALSWSRHGLQRESCGPTCTC